MFDWLIVTSFHYGNPSDYDEWARLGGEGAESWAYKAFHKSAKLPLFERVNHGSDLVTIQILLKI